MALDPVHQVVGVIGQDVLPDGLGALRLGPDVLLLCPTTGRYEDEGRIRRVKVAVIRRSRLYVSIGF